MTDLRDAARQALEALWTAATPQAEEAITALRDALAQPKQEPQFWEYDDGLTMNRRVYRHGKLMAVIPIEIIQDTPQMRPFRVAHSFGNREHRPKDRIPQTFEEFLATDAGVRMGLKLKDEWIDAARVGWEAAMRAKQENV